MGVGHQFARTLHTLASIRALAERGVLWRDAAEPTKKAIEDCVLGCKRLLDDAFAGAYLHGSLATGSYNADKSDVDLLVVAQTPVSYEVRGKALAIFEQCSEKLPGGGLEGSLVPLSSVNGLDKAPRWLTHRSNVTSVAVVDEGGTIDDDLVLQCNMARIRGIALAGPPCAIMFSLVSFETFVDSLLQDVSWMTAAHQLSVHPAYAVLNGCRLLVVEARRCAIAIDKVEGALEAATLIDSSYHPLIDRALRDYTGADTFSLADFEGDGLCDFLAVVQAAAVRLRAQTGVAVGL